MENCKCEVCNYGKKVVEVSKARAAIKAYNARPYYAEEKAAELSHEYCEDNNKAYEDLKLSIIKALEDNGIVMESYGERKARKAMDAQKEAASILARMSKDLSEASDDGWAISMSTLQFYRKRAKDAFDDIERNMPEIIEPIGKRKEVK